LTPKVEVNHSTAERGNIEFFEKLSSPLMGED
jgi:hypothetical protein